MSGATTATTAPRAPKNSRMEINAANTDGTPWRRIHVVGGASTVQMIRARMIGSRPTQNVLSRNHSA